MKDIVHRLPAIVRKRNVHIKFVLLNKGFCSVDVISNLKRATYGFVIPAVPRGRKPKRRNARVSGHTVDDAHEQRRAVSIIKLIFDQREVVVAIQEGDDVGVVILDGVQGLVENTVACRVAPAEN